MQAPISAFAGMGRNAQTIATEITKMSQENIEAGAKAAQMLREVKSLPDVVGIQTDLLKATFETIGAHYPRIVEIVASTPVEIIKGYQEALGKIVEAGSGAAQKASNTTRAVVEQTTAAAREATDKTADAVRRATR